MRDEGISKRPVGSFKEFVNSFIPMTGASTKTIGESIVRMENEMKGFETSQPGKNLLKAKLNKKAK